MRTHLTYLVWLCDATAALPLAAPVRGICEDSVSHAIRNIRTLNSIHVSLSLYIIRPMMSLVLMCKLAA